MPAAGENFFSSLKPATGGKNLRLVNMLAAGEFFFTLYARRRRKKFLSVFEDKAPPLDKVPPPKLGFWA